MNWEPGFLTRDPCNPFASSITSRDTKKCHNKHAIRMEEYFLVTKINCFLSSASIYIHLFRLRGGLVDPQRPTPERQDIGSTVSWTPGHCSPRPLDKAVRAACKLTHCAADPGNPEGTTINNITALSLLPHPQLHGDNAFIRLPQYWTLQQKHQSLSRFWM